MLEEIKNIANMFDIKGELVDIKVNNTGNINRTFIATYKDGSKKKQYIIQKINTTVFKEPYKLMKNIENITSWIEKRLKFKGDSIHGFLKVIPTKDKKILAVSLDDSGEKEYYRAYNYIENSISYDVSTDKKVVYNTGKAFGNFQKLLINYPINTIEETIKDFHNTPKRYQSFLNDISLDVCDRVDAVSKEIIFVIKNSECMSTIIDLMKKNRIPTRVTHNDTKISNVMMNKDTGDYLTVIDLDTVMLGSSLFDYGDGVRSTASNSSEDELDLDKVYLNNELFEAYTDGYLSEMGQYLTEEEVCNMGESIKIITLELGLRFLDDYINGDTYFKNNYDNHNLDKPINQFKLFMDINDKMSYINEYILNKYKELVKGD